jgi:hypothetical protein
MALSGCIENVAEACIVTANGIPIETFSNVKGPAYDGYVPEDCAGVNSVGGGPFGKFADQFNDANDGLCHDYYNAGDVLGNSFAIFGNAFNAFNNCTLVP